MLVVAQVSCCQSEVVVDQVSGALTIHLGRQDGHCMGDNEVKCLQKEGLVFFTGAELRQTELDSVDEGTDRVDAVAFKSLADQRLQVRGELHR